jgi:hypothetical protein
MLSGFGRGGTACLQIIPEPLGAAVRFRASAIPLSEIVVADNAVYRPRVITAQELVELSGGGPNEQLKNPDDSIDIVEFSILHQGRYVQGVMIDGSSDLPRLVRAVMTDHSPYIVFRWQKTAGAAFGQSPVMKALPDIKTANTVVELILKNASIAVTGLWQAEDDGVMNLANITLTPGAIIPKAVGSAGLKPLEMPARFDVSQLVLDDLRARIRHALLADRFAQIETRRMTATEVIERADDSALILGAVYGRLQSELLTPLLTRLYDLYRAAGDIADLPLDGRTVQLLHRSPLARAQAMRGVQTILTLVDAAASLGANATATLNAPAIVRDIAETLGVPDHFIMPNPINALSIQSLTENIGE